jgi:hypothetical protein
MQATLEALDAAPATRTRAADPEAADAKISLFGDMAGSR